MKRALERPSDFVVKPQREGGGEVCRISDTSSGRFVTGNTR